MRYNIDVLNKDRNLKSIVLPSSNGSIGPDIVTLILFGFIPKKSTAPPRGVLFLRCSLPNSLGEVTQSGGGVCTAP